MANPKRALVTLPEGVWQIIESELKGKLGDGDSEVIRNIVISYLTDKGHFDAGKVRMAEKRLKDNEVTNIWEQLKINLASIQALLNLLGARNLIDLQEWQRRYDIIRNEQKGVNPVRSELSRPVGQIRVTIYRITLPVSIADKLGESVQLQYSDSDKSLTVRRSSNGEFKVRQVGKVRSTRSINCKGFVIVNNIPKGTYPGYWDEDGQMLIVKLS